MVIKEFFSVNNDCYKQNIKKTDSRFVNFQKNGPQGLMLHSVGCPQPNAEVFAKAWNKSGTTTAVHAVLQADGLVYQCLPWSFRGWHGGGSSNNTYIGVEMTEPDCIKYTNGSNFTCSNLTKAQEQVKGTYKTAVELFAFLCKEFNLDPLKDIISHKEGCARGIASNHGDPDHLWKGLKLGYTMDGFRKDVKAAMTKTTTTTSKPVEKKEESTLYKVQTGAYKTKKNAEKQLNKLETSGFPAFIVKEDAFYKVQVGSYTVKANADNIVKKLKEAGFTVCIKTVKTEKVTNLKVGDKVKLKENAYIYGKKQKFQSWVYNSTLYVRAIDNDKITISTQNTGAITGIVDIADVIKL